MSKRFGSPLTRRLAKKLGVGIRKAAGIQRAFVAALKEEVDARFGPASCMDLFKEPNRLVPLVVEGLGSFKMRTRPVMAFDVPGSVTNDHVTKPPARRLVMSAKWKEISEVVDGERT